MEDKKPDDFLQIFTNKIYEFDWVIIFCVAISYLLVVSDIFHDSVIYKFSGTKDGIGNLTTYGYIIQLLSLLIGTIISRAFLSMTG